MINAVAEMLKTYAGLDPEGEHGKETPSRFVKMLDELTQCKSSGNPETDETHLFNCVKWKTFPTEDQDMIVVQNIPFVSLCNHHLVPFLGTAQIGYVPNKEVAGLSKFARVVRHFARRLQVQEELTKDIASFLEEKLGEPKGVAVLLEAEHMCMTVRGIQAIGTYTTTSSMRGVFSRHDRTAKAEFMQIIGGKK